MRKESALAKIFMMLRMRSFLRLFILGAVIMWAFMPALFPIPTLSASPHQQSLEVSRKGFWISNDMFWKDNVPYRIIGGDVHYFRVLPEQYWEDRLLRAKALGLNTIQTYVPWNLHEPQPGKWVFEGVADLESYLKLANEMGFIVMLRVGPYICAEWDFGGFPAWLLSVEPPLRLRSSDLAYLLLVERWWNYLLPKLVPLLYNNGGPIIMVQVENEYGSFGDDKKYLHHLVALARVHLGEDVILYTTDGGSRDTLDKGTVLRKDVFAAVDFSTGENPIPIFELQKKYNAPGRSPALSTEFYTGWLTHWDERIAKTDASSTAVALDTILSQNASVVLYMAHGGTNFGFFNGANTGQSAFDYKPDLTSYDYDAPIKEFGDVENPKFKALRAVIQKHSTGQLPPIPLNKGSRAYGQVKVKKIGSLFELLDFITEPTKVVKTHQPMPMEKLGQFYGFMLYVSEYPSKEFGRVLSIKQVKDRAQVFVACKSTKILHSPIYVGKIERWSSVDLHLPSLICPDNISILILVENMGRVNYGPFIYDRKGILSDVMLDGSPLYGWRIFPISFDGISNISNVNLIKQAPISRTLKKIIQNDSMSHLKLSKGPGVFEGHLSIDSSDEVKDTFISLKGWNKGVLFVNNFNIGRFWVSVGPQCTLYLPAPLLHYGENVVELYESYAYVHVQANTTYHDWLDNKHASGNP
ncbi:hypothetical protein AMTR_s00052p00218230 [Amborella trichopoda]|uniref:Beta-galactosidase n=1 Tax=Amborella trichopoda TaxID=13333 RepID=U5D2K1_AMBTC|nr:hypothetical protein AMTR_s00052p00218230 [Amborella trichopoda]